MRAWLKGYKHGAFTQQPPVTIPDRCNGIDLGMTLATTPVPPLPYLLSPPGAAITAPTIGLGDANPLPFSARAIALRMYNSLSINQTVKFMPYLVNDRLVNHQ